MKKQSIFITGANGGMGFETTKILAKQGFERIVMAGRTDKKAKDARARLLQEIQPQGTIEAAGGFDMQNAEAIDKAVAALPKNKPFDIVFLQAGGVIFSDDYEYIPVGENRIEKTVFQNTIGGYITLVNLEKQGLLAPNVRVVFAGGEGARGIPGMIEKPVFKSAEAFKNYLHGIGTQKKYNPMNAIGVSKLTSALLVQQLAVLNDRNEYVWFSPGLTHGTNGLSSQSAVKRFFAEKIIFGITGLLGFSQSPTQGAQKYVDALTGKIGQNGDVLGAPEGKVLGKITNQKSMNPSITDPALIDSFRKIIETVYSMPTSIT